MKIKENVNQFDRDVVYDGGYQYTGSRLSSRIANKRMSMSIQEVYDFSNKSVLDCGCGDGAYTKDFVDFGASEVVALDPAKEAIALAEKNRTSEKVVFAVGDIYNLKENSLMRARQRMFDVAVLRGVLHHVSDQANAVKSVSGVAEAVIVVEPNGSNPVLKIIEKVSKYHIAHEEQSFSMADIDSWLRQAGFRRSVGRYINLVPFFCPDWFARIANILTPLVERIPVLRRFACGQIVIKATKE
jgi:2-polyprenyl-3-methyl-5-hydroxy-6-metoxy-1,4-benzoquinol methylase